MPFRPLTSGPRVRISSSTMNTLPIHPDAPWLAPLAGYSDLPFRMLCRHYGCAVACTEMVSAKGLYHGGGNTDRLLDTCPGDDPVVLQLFGSDPDVFPYVMDAMLERGFRHFEHGVHHVREDVRIGTEIG